MICTVRSSVTLIPSLCFGIARPTIDECVSPDKRNEWYEKSAIFSLCIKEFGMFESQKIANKEFTKKTSGLYELEYSGEGMICLNRKVYLVWGFNDGGELICKTSSKGMRINKKIYLKCAT